MYQNQKYFRIKWHYIVWEEIPCRDGQCYDNVSISNPPQFFKNMGLKSWSNVGLSIGVIIIGTIFMSIILVAIRKKLTSSSNILQKTKNVSDSFISIFTKQFLNILWKIFSEHFKRSIWCQIHGRWVWIWRWRGFWWRFHQFWAC